MAAAVRKERPNGLPTQMPKAADDETTVRTTTKRPCREDTSMIAANFKTPVSLAWRSLLARLSEDRGRRVTGQDGLAEAILDLFTKYRQKPPTELVEAARAGGAEIPPDPAPPNPRKPRHLKSVEPGG
jgi:hypothetical protein